MNKHADTPAATAAINLLRFGQVGRIRLHGDALGRPLVARALQALGVARSDGDLVLLAARETRQDGVADAGPVACSDVGRECRANLCIKYMATRQLK